MGLTPVDCIACLVAAPSGFAWGWRDEDGVVHYAKWIPRGTIYPLCDFDDDGDSRLGARRIDRNELIAVREDV